MTLIDCDFFDQRGMVGKEPFNTRPHVQKMQKFILNLMKIGKRTPSAPKGSDRRRTDLIGEGKRRRSPMGLEVVSVQGWEHMRSHDDVLWPIRVRYSKGSHRRTRLPETLTTLIDDENHCQRQKAKTVIPMTQLVFRPSLHPSRDKAPVLRSDLRNTDIHPVLSVLTMFPVHNNPPLNRISHHNNRWPLCADMVFHLSLVLQFGLTVSVLSFPRGT